MNYLSRVFRVVVIVSALETDSSLYITTTEICGSFFCVETSAIDLKL